MNYTLDLIGKLKDKKGLDSDYAVAKALKIHPNRISNYRTGKSHADDKMAIVLADELGLDRLQTIARINADRAADATDKAFWRKVAAHAACAVISSSLYIMSILGHRRLAAVA